MGGLLQTYRKGGGKKWQEEDAKKTHRSCPREKRLAPHSWAGTTSVACPNSGCNPHWRNRSANISLLDDIPPSVEQPFILNPLWKPFPKQLKEPSAFHNREEFSLWFDSAFLRLLRKLEIVSEVSFVGKHSKGQPQFAICVHANRLN